MKTALEEIEACGERIQHYHDVRASWVTEAQKHLPAAIAKGHSISEIARAAGVSRPTIYQWLKETK